MNPTLHYEEGFKYQVYEDYRIELTELIGYEIQHEFFSINEVGVLIIKRGYAWDGASGPTIDTKSSIIGSLVHDVLYQMLRLGLLPHDPCFHIANAILRDLCKEDGMWQWRADKWFDAVEKFGNAHAAVQPDVILVAP